VCSKNAKKDKISATCESLCALIFDSGGLSDDKSTGNQVS